MSSVGLVREFLFQSYNYREFLRQSVARDMRKKYKRSALGYVWSMLNPLLMMTILAVVFSNIMRSNLQDYAVFLFCGMIPFNYFNSTINGCLNSVRSNAKIIDHVPVPKFIFPMSKSCYDLLNFFLSLVPLLIVMLVLGRTFHQTILLLPVVIVPLFFCSLGCALIFSVANVFFEDVEHLVGVLLRALYFLSPILYGRDMIPDWLVKWVVFNPMFIIIESMRNLFYYGTTPDWQAYTFNLIGCMLLLLFGLWLFRKTDDKFIYFI